MGAYSIYYLAAEGRKELDARRRLADPSGGEVRPSAIRNRMLCHLAEASCFWMAFSQRKPGVSTLSVVFPVPCPQHGFLNSRPDSCLPNRSSRLLRVLGEEA